MGYLPSGSQTYPPMTSVIDLYEQLSSAPDDRARARVIAEAFEQMEQRYPEVTDLATGAALRESELRLQKEIEQLRAETREMEGRLQQEIEKLRGDVFREIEQLRGDMSREIEQLRGDVSREIEQLRGDVSREIAQLRGETQVRMAELRGDMGSMKVEIIKWTAGLLLAQATLILGGLRFLL